MPSPTRPHRSTSRFWTTRPVRAERADLTAALAAVTEPGRARRGHRRGLPATVRGALRGRRTLRPPADPGDIRQLHPGRCRRGDPGGAGRRRGLARTGLRLQGGDPAPRRRTAGRSVAGQGERRDHAGPGQDRVPGRDRLGLRAGRLLAVQRAFRPADPARTTDRQREGNLEPHRPPAAGGLRLRGHPVQLHRHRRQPADRAGADGQRRRLEAVDHPATGRVADHGPAAGGRAAAAG